MHFEPKTLKEIEEEVAVSIARNSSAPSAGTAGGGYGTFAAKPPENWGLRHVAMAAVSVLAIIFLLLVLR